LTTSFLEPTLRPDLVSYPVAGEIATLPYEHEVFTVNPYASESISVTNNVVYGYEGSIGLIPAEDVWFEHRAQPQIINHYNTQVVYNTVTVREEVVREVERIVEVVVHVPVESGPEPPPPSPPPPSPPPPPPQLVVPDTPVLTVLPPPVVILIEPEPIIEGRPPVLPDDSPAPPQEVPVSYGGSGGGGFAGTVYGGGMSWRGGETEAISSFALQLEQQE
jgi:hypothetical protein